MTIEQLQTPRSAAATKTKREAWFELQVQRLARKHRAGWLSDGCYNREIDRLLRLKRKGVTH